MKKARPVALLFQMGKVGSNAISQALEQRGYRTYRAHSLGRDQLVLSLDRMLNPRTNDIEVRDSLPQLGENLKISRLLAQYRTDAQNERPRLKIITLSRHPVDWYWSALIQNFESRSHDMQRFKGLEPSREIAESTLFDFHAELFEFLDRQIDSAGPRFREEITRLNRSSTDLRVSILSRFAQIFVAPLRWFERRFQPVTGIDIYAHDFDPQRGWLTLNAGYCDLLCLKFEVLGDPILREFLEDHRVKLRRENASREKPGYGRVGRVANEITLSPELREMLRETAYCRFFGYLQED